MPGMTANMATAKNANPTEAIHPRSANDSGWPRICAKLISIPAMNSTAAVPICCIVDRNPSDWIKPSTWGPMRIPSTTSRTTVGTRTPVGISAKSGATTATAMTTNIG